MAGSSAYTANNDQNPQRLDGISEFISAVSQGLHLLAAPPHCLSQSALRNVSDVDLPRLCAAVLQGVDKTPHDSLLNPLMISGISNLFGAITVRRVEAVPFEDRIKLSEAVERFGLRPRDLTSLFFTACWRGNNEELFAGLGEVDSLARACYHYTMSLRYAEQLCDQGLMRRDDLLILAPLVSLARLARSSECLADEWRGYCERIKEIMQVHRGELTPQLSAGAWELYFYYSKLGGSEAVIEALERTREVAEGADHLGIAARASFRLGECRERIGDLSGAIAANADAASMSLSCRDEDLNDLANLSVEHLRELTEELAQRVKAQKRLNE